MATELKDKKTWIKNFILPKDVKRFYVLQTYTERHIKINKKN